MEKEKRIIKPTILNAKREVNEDGVEVLRLVAPVMGEESLKAYDQIVNKKIKTSEDEIDNAIREVVEDFEAALNQAIAKAREDFFEALTVVRDDLTAEEKKSVADNNVLKSELVTKIETDDAANKQEVLGVIAVVETKVNKNTSDIASEASKSVADNAALKTELTQKINSDIGDLNSSLSGGLNEAIEGLRTDVEESITDLSDSTDTKITQVNTTLTSTKNELSSTIESNKSALETKIENAISELNTLIASLPTSTDLGEAIAAAMRSVYTYKGSVASATNLPTGYGEDQAGWVYNLEDTGMNVAWTGSKWDPLGQESFQIDLITPEEYQSILNDGDVEDGSAIVSATAYKALYDRMKTFVSGDVSGLQEVFTEAINQARTDLTNGYTAADNVVRADIANAYLPRDGSKPMTGELNLGNYPLNFGSSKKLGLVGFVDVLGMFPAFTGSNGPGDRVPVVIGNPPTDLPESIKERFAASIGLVKELINQNGSGGGSGAYLKLLENDLTEEANLYAGIILSYPEAIAFAREVDEELTLAPLISATPEDPGGEYVVNYGALFDKLGEYLPLDGSTPMNGDLNVSGHGIILREDDTTEWLLHGNTSNNYVYYRYRNKETGEYFTCFFSGYNPGQISGNPTGSYCPSLTGVNNNFLNLQGTNVPRADLNMGTHKLTNLATPTADTDAATKAYVDGLVGNIGTTLDAINGEVI